MSPIWFCTGIISTSVLQIFTSSPIRDHLPATLHHSQLDSRHEIKRLTKLNSLHTGSEGCAPTPNQYFVRLKSNVISLYFLAVFSSSSDRPYCVCGFGLYVPRTSIGFEFLAVLRLLVYMPGVDGEIRDVPCLREDDVVGRLALDTEAREADLENHFGMCVRV